MQQAVRRLLLENPADGLKVPQQPRNEMRALTVDFLGDGDGTFVALQFPTGSTPIYIAVADFNLDGRPDLAITNDFDNSISILLNTGGGSFSVGPRVATGSFPKGIVAADFNDDGFLDIAIADNGTGLTVLFGGSNLMFTSETISLGSTSPALRASYRGFQRR